MPIVIPADRWEFDPDTLGPDLMENHEPKMPITTEGILEGLDKLYNRPEMDKLDTLLMQSNMYLPGKANAKNR